MFGLQTCENILGTYTLVEILEYNDLTEAEVLYMLLQQKIVELPECLPL